MKALTLEERRSAARATLEVSAMVDTVDKSYEVVFSVLWEGIFDVKASTRNTYVYLCSSDS